MKDGQSLRLGLLELIASWDKRLQAPSALQRSIYKEIVLDLFKLIHEYDLKKSKGQKEIVGFKMELSKRNTQNYILIAIDEENKEWVVSGDSYNPTYLVKSEVSFDLKTK